MNQPGTLAQRLAAKNTGWAGRTEKRVWKKVAEAFRHDEGVERVFRQLDPDHLGSITANELEVGLRTMNVNLDEHERSVCLKLADPTGSGRVQYGGFVNQALDNAVVYEYEAHEQRQTEHSEHNRAHRHRSAVPLAQVFAEKSGLEDSMRLANLALHRLTTNIRNRGESMRAVFDRYDVDNDHTLSKDELKQGLADLGVHTSAKVRGWDVDLHNCARLLGRCCFAHLFADQITNSPNSPTHQLTNSTTHQLNNSTTQQLTNSP